MRLRYIVAAATMLCGTLAARADNFSFNSEGVVFTFSLPGSPTPFDSFSGSGFDTGPVPVQIAEGSAITDTSLNFGFTNINDDETKGGFIFFIDGTQFRFAGPQLYTGAEASPTFLTGSFDLATRNGFTGILTISQTPEPSTFALLGTGLLGAVGVLRRRFA